MNAIHQTVEWLDQHKGCGWACLKCNFNLRMKFESLDQERRDMIVGAICACDLEDLESHQQLLWLLALLTDAEFDRFVRAWASRTPYGRSQAWQIIHLSTGNQGAWRFNICGQQLPSFKPRFHLHPLLAPLLLAATIRKDTQTEDAVTLLEYFESIAHAHPVLKDALPLWRREQVRREDARKAERASQAEQERIEEERLSAAKATQEAQFQAVETSGPSAILRAIRDSATLTACADRWAKLSERALSTIPQELLDEVARRIANERVDRPWRGLRNRIVHMLTSRTRSMQRRVHLGSLAHSPLIERLEVASQSGWPLTYFPEDWAEELIQEASTIPSELQQRLLDKLMRLRRRTTWRTARTTMRVSRRAEPDTVSQGK